MKLYERCSAEIYEARASFSNRYYNGDYNGHPDTRAIACPSELVLSSEWFSRNESSENYVLGDGAYYDPASNEFYGIETISNKSRS